MVKPTRYDEVMKIRSVRVPDAIWEPALEKSKEVLGMPLSQAIQEFCQVIADSSTQTAEKTEDLAPDTGESLRC